MYVYINIAKPVDHRVLTNFAAERDKFLNENNFQMPTYKYILYYQPSRQSRTLIPRVARK